MAISVAQNLAHPAAFFRRDDSSGITIFDGVSVYEVDGLDDGSSDAAATLLARAERADGIPQPNTIHPDTLAAAVGCKVKSVRAVAVSQADNRANVYVEWWTQVASFTGGVGIMSVERQTVMVGSSASYHPATGQQIGVKPPVSGKGTPYYSEVGYSVPMLKLVITANVRTSNMNSFENAVGCVNGDTFFGRNPGFWRWDELREISNLGQGYKQVAVGLVSPIHHNWFDALVFRNDVIGSTLKASDAAIASIRTAWQGSGYFYGMTQLDGATLIGLYPTISFHDVLGISADPFQ